MDNPIWNKDLNDWEICGTCLEVVNSCFEDHVEEEEEKESNEINILSLEEIFSLTDTVK